MLFDKISLINERKKELLMPICMEFHYEKN